MVEEELSLIATRVAELHSGRNRGDRARYERCGVNVKTAIKYLHVLRLWIHFCLCFNMFHVRWDHAALPECVWSKVAVHWSSLTARGTLADSSLESYMRMLSHTLIYMAADPAQYGRLHARERSAIQKVVDAFCLRHPECRTIRNTKSAWDDVLVDAAMRLLLLWHVHGHCQKRSLAWPCFARMALGMLNYLGWRPFSLTRDRVDAHDDRWRAHPICSFGHCLLAWEHGLLVSVQVHGVRTKFRRNPRQEMDESGVLRDVPVLDGKLTYSVSVDTCPVLAWLAWAVLCGAFGYDPLYVTSAGYVSSQGDTLGFTTCEQVDELIVSIFTIQPDRVLSSMMEMPIMVSWPMDGRMVHVCTDRLSNTMHIVGVRLGLNPRKCSAVSGRKTFATAVVLHPETTDLDCTRTFGHANPRLTTQACYTEACARTADSRAIMEKRPVRSLPGSVMLSHNRNLNPNIQAAILAGRTAADSIRVRYMRRRVGEELATLQRLNAYKQAFRADMQRQYDAHAHLPRAGATREQLGSFFFKPYCGCQEMSQAQFVAWQVKVALGLLPAPEVCPENGGVNN